MQNKLKARNRYTVDNSNRLVIKRGRKNMTANGRFSINKDNRLVYWLNEPPAWRTRYNLPGRITFEGKWQLNPNYDLELVLDEAREQFKGDRLVLKGEIISTDEDTLVFEMISYKKGLSPTELRRSYAKGAVPESSIRLLKLSGFWQADEHNRIIFTVKKKATLDILTLEGAWQINKNQQIVYSYEKTELKRKIKTLHTLTFQGFWQIDSAKRLTYILSRSTKSRFDFRVQIESPNLYPKRGTIKYRLGIGLREEKNFQTKIISLYGTWKFSKKYGLLFIMDYGQGKIQSIEFGTDIYLTKKDEVTFSLTTTRKEPLGIYLTFTHKFLERNAAEVFLRLKKVQKEAGIEAGVRIPF